MSAPDISGYQNAVKWVFVTDQGMPNPYGALPTYLSGLAAQLSSLNAPAPVPASVKLTIDRLPSVGDSLLWSATGLSDDEGGVVQFGFVPVGVNPAPVGAGFLVVQSVLGDKSGSANGSIPVTLNGIPALAPDLRTQEIYPGATFDCYAYDAAAGSPSGYSNPVTVTVNGFVLGSNSNYVFDNGCSPIPSPTVSIQVSEAMAASNGFGFQLNAYSPKGGVCAYQQYCIVLTPQGQLEVNVDNWPVSGNNLLNDWALLATPGTVKAGDALSMSLTTDASGNVTACTYGYNSASLTIQLSTIANFQPSYLAPIVAFELDLVGPFNGESTVLSTGAGTITYASSSDMTPLTTEPSACTETTAVTAETANSQYGALPTAPAKAFTQSFQTTPTAAIRRPGPVRRATRRAQPL